MLKEYIYSNNNNHSLVWLNDFEFEHKRTSWSCLYAYRGQFCAEATYILEEHKQEKRSSNSILEIFPYSRQMNLNWKKSASTKKQAYFKCVSKGAKAKNDVDADLSDFNFNS